MKRILSRATTPDQYNANILVKDMNPTILPPVTDGLLNMGIETNLRGIKTLKPCS